MQVIHNINQLISKIIYRTNHIRHSHTTNSNISGLSTYIRIQHNIRTVGLTSSFLFSLLLLTIIIPLYNVTGVEDIMATTTPCTNDGDGAIGTNCSLTFTSTRLTASADLTVSSTDGTFASSSSSNNAAFTLSTNNYTGYALTLAGSSTTTTLNTTGGDTLSSITTNTTATDFSANNATGKANNNKWGIMPSSYKSNNSITSNNTTTFFPSPSSTNTITMDETTSANSGSGQAKSYTIGLGVRADYTKTAGTYNNTNSGNTIIIAYVANPTNYAITYNKGNTEDTVNSLPSTQGGNVSATSIALSNTIPTRTGYDFKGWCTVMPTTSNNNDSCAGTIYNADGANTAAALTFPINRTTDSNTATLYAMWNIKTFTITVQDGGNTTVTGSGTYQYGEEVTLTATPTTSTTCVSYNTPTWTATKTGGGTATGSLNATSGNSVTYTVGLTNDTITATSTATNNTFTIIFNTSNASSIAFNGTNKSNNTTGSYTCGNYTISGNYASNYEFDSWSRTGSGGFTTSSTSTSTSASSTTASTYFRVQGEATITLTGKSSKLWFQNATSANCGSTMYDNRGTDAYKNIAYSTAKIGSLCWMTRNLDLPGGTTLSSSDTNLTTGFTLPASSTSGFNSYNTDYVYNSGRTTCSKNSSTGSCYSYYSFYTATAHWGTNSVSSGSSSVDICPKGWRLPTLAEYSTLYSSYNTGAKLVASPWYGVYSGNYYYGSFNDGGSLGCYWSSTAVNSVSAYYLYFGSSSAGVGNLDKVRGFAVRCVAKS